MHCRPPHRRALQPGRVGRARDARPGRDACHSAWAALPLHFRGRRSSFKGGAVPVVAELALPARRGVVLHHKHVEDAQVATPRQGGGGSRGARQGKGVAASCARENCAQWSGPRATPRVADEVGEAVGEERENPALPGCTAASGQGRTVDSQASAEELPGHRTTQSLLRPPSEFRSALDGPGGGAGGVGMRRLNVRRGKGGGGGHRERCASGSHGAGERCASGSHGAGERCASGLYGRGAGGGGAPVAVHRIRSARRGGRRSGGRWWGSLRGALPGAAGRAQRQRPESKTRPQRTTRRRVALKDVDQSGSGSGERARGETPRAASGGAGRAHASSSRLAVAPPPPLPR